MTNSKLAIAARALTALVLWAGTSMAHATYWNLFNEEGESSKLASFVTYASLDDMLRDKNRVGVFSPDNFDGGRFGVNVVGAGSDGTTFWNLFNEESESSKLASFVTYASLDDMLRDKNRVGVFSPDTFDGGRFGVNVVGTGSDGSTYWNLFNEEGESSKLASFVTYASLDDMLRDKNRVGVFSPDNFDGGRFGVNVVGAGSDGTTFWNLFNEESESSKLASFVTYASLDDMLRDKNRVGVFSPDTFDGGRFGVNVVGSGSDVFRPPVPSVPEPSNLLMMCLGLAALAAAARREVAVGAAQPAR